MRTWWSLLLVLLYPSHAAASECIGFWTQDLLNSRQTVFVGEVVSITGDGTQDEIRFRVTEAFKLDVPRRNPLVLTQWVNTRRSDFDHQFQVGNTYLVFAFDNSDGKLSATPRGVTSRHCDAWEIHTAEGKSRLAELRPLLRNRQFLPLRH